MYTILLFLNMESTASALPRQSVFRGSPGFIVDCTTSRHVGTKKGNELMSHTYSRLYGLPTPGFCFFSV